MKYVAILLAALALTGCARWNDRFHGSWLDQVGQPANPPVAMSEDNAKSLTAEALSLRAEAEGVRLKLAGETDRVRRIAYLRELRDIGDKLHPIERQLQDAGRALPASTVAAAPRAG